MNRSSHALVLIVASALSLAACKKQEEPQAVPLPSATTPAPVGADSSGAAGTTADAPVTAAPTVAPPVVNPHPVQQASIDACCSALAAVAHSGRGKDAKIKSAQASKICPGIAKLVKSGQTTRASALTQIKSALVGVDVPGECR
jgi:hypothetical protein